MTFWLDDSAAFLLVNWSPSPLLSLPGRLALEERRLSFRRSSGSFFIFKESFLTVPGDLSRSITDPAPFFGESDYDKMKTMTNQGGGATVREVEPLGGQSI